VSWPFSSFLARSFGFSLLWILLSGASTRNLPLAAIAIVSATVASLRLWPARPRRVRWSRLPGLLAFFLWNALKGGVDVAWRALSPRLPLAPDLLEYTCRLHSENGRVWFTWMIGLMPGTASVQWRDGGRVVVHVIDWARYDHASLQRLEWKMAALLGDPLADGSQ
jgi:multicomponent Na+:H+ antiporter subunit E